MKMNLNCRFNIILFRLECANGIYFVQFQAGWTGGYNCPVNIDECAASPSPCGPLYDCVDTQGSYECVCISGYEESPNGECQGNVCDQPQVVGPKDDVNGVDRQTWVTCKYKVGLPNIRISKYQFT